MTEPRSIGVTIFSILYIVGGLIATIIVLAPVTMYFSAPQYLKTSFDHVIYGNWKENAYFLYLNTFLVLRLFIGFGLWRTEAYAWRLLMFILLAESIEPCYELYVAVTQQNHFEMGKAVGTLAVHLLVFLFFRRQSIRDQFFEPETVSPAPQIASPAMTAPAAGTALPQSIHPLVAAKMRQTSIEESDDLIPLSGMENIASWVLMFSGITYSLRWKMTIVESGIFGGIWGLASYLLCYYIFRARKLAMFTGGGLAIMLSIPAYFFLLKVPNPWLPIAASVLVNLIGGFVAGQLVKSNQWFHASAGGFVWSLAQTFCALYQKYDGKITMERLEPMVFIMILLGAMLAGVVSALAGGGLAMLVRFDRKPPEEPGPPPIQASH